MTDIDAIEKRILEAVVKIQLEGFKLAPGSTFSKIGKQCCPMGAAGRSMYLADAAAKLGVDRAWVGSFADGFDGVPDDRLDRKQAYDLGRKFRAEFVDGAK